MANKRRYLYMHRGDNEWLASDPPTDLKELGEWHIEWAKLRKDCEHFIEITEDMYANDEYGEVPDWVDVTLHDEGVLAFKMARGVIGGLAGATSVVFSRHYDITISEEWGGWDFNRLEIYEGSAYLTFRGKHSNAEVELNITKQFSQAIGE